MAIDAKLFEYHVDGYTSSLLDAATAPSSHVAYWMNGRDKITTEAHLDYINSLGIYTIDVSTIINYLKTLTENQAVEERFASVEEMLGTPLRIGGLTDVSLSQPIENDVLTVGRDGKIINKLSADRQFTRTNVLFSTYLNYKWVTIANYSITTNNIEINDYKITLNFLAEVTNNNRWANFGIFVNGVYQTHIYQAMRFDQGNDAKSITIIDVLYDVSPRSKIEVKVLRAKGNGSTLKIQRRTMFAEELI